MSHTNSVKVRKNDVFYYTRIIPNCGIYDVLEIKIRSVYEDYFVGIEKRDKHVFLFYYSNIDKILFRDRKIAVNKANEAEKNKRKIVSEETYYEEY